MRNIHHTFEDLLKNLPQQFLERAIKEKLAKSGINGNERAISRGARQLINGKARSFCVIDANGAKHTVKMTPDELNSILEELNDFTENKLSEVTANISDEAADVMLKSYYKNWPREWKRQEKQDRGFRERLEQRWGKALGLIRMMLTISREWGEEIFERKRAATEGKFTVLEDVLLRLHVRACQITNEILVLLENGFADGAMARWRSLHEVSTVGLVIAKYGEDMAFLYTQHQYVEAMKALNAYEASYQELGYKPYNPEEAAKIRSDFAAVVKKYGKSFEGDYGWAAKSFNMERVTFQTLQEKADQKRMRAHYRMASYNVHAGPHGVYFKLGGVDMVAGASNAGLFEPAQNAVLSLGKATTAISAPPYNTQPKFGDIVYGKIFLKLVCLIPEELGKAEDQLERDADQYGVSSSM